MLEASAEPVVEENRSSLRRARTIALGAAAVLLVVAAVLYGPTAWEINQERGTTIVTPAQVAGLRLDQSDSARNTAEYVRSAVATEAQFSKSTGAVYVDQGGESRSVIFVGGTGLMWSPGKTLESVFAIITDDTGGVSQPRDVPAGPLGGVMRCGTTATDGGQMAVCGWADHGCLAVSLFPNRSADESAKLLREMRGNMQHRS
jgi:hypothetical protein